MTTKVMGVLLSHGISIQ